MVPGSYTATSAAIVKELLKGWIYDVYIYIILPTKIQLK